MLRKPATTTPQFHTTWRFGKDWQHAAVHLQKYCFLLKLRHFSQKGSLQQSHFRGRKQIGFLDSKKWSSPVQHVDVCVILPAFCGFIVSAELLKQLGAFRASYRNPKNRVATRSNAWIWRARFWSRLIEMKKKTFGPVQSEKRWRVAIPFLAVWNLATCSKHEALCITQVIKVGFCSSSKL